MRTLRRTVSGRFLVASLLLVALGGCNLTTESSIALDPEEELPAGEVLVFGKFTVLNHDGDEFSYGTPKYIPFVGSRWLMVYSLCLLDCAEQRVYGYYLRDDGSFLWHLSPGHYEIRALRASNGVQVLTRTMRAVFTVPAVNVPVYIGEYRFPEYQPVKSHVIRNQLDVHTAIIAERYPELCGQAKVCLMKIEAMGQ